MSTDYLLPCTCGRSHRVSIRQAGETFACPCGVQLEVPTMRELKKLEPAAAVAAPRQRAWGLPQGLMFLGGVVAVFGICCSCYYGLFRMPAPKEFTDVHPELIGQLSPAMALDYFKFVQQGVTALPPPDVARFGRLNYDRDVANRGLHLGWLVIALGGALSGVGVLIGRRQAKLG